MKALSVRQPWAWLIVRGLKPVENRVWTTTVRGRVAIHASQSMTREDYERAAMIAEPMGIFLPAKEGLPRGGIVGTVQVVDVVTALDSPWFEGPYGFVLQDPKLTAFRPVKGRLGWFDVDIEGGR